MKANGDLKNFVMVQKKINHGGMRRCRVSRLDNIENWPELVEKSNWSVAELATICGVTVRTLQRYIRSKFGRTPKAFIIGQRQKRALDLATEKGMSVKELAWHLQFKYATHFSREFKKYWGCSPTDKNGTVNSM